MRDQKRDETWHRNVPFKDGRGIIKPAYSHWTIAYALTIEGARKLIDANPLDNILPVDEFLPIMFDKQPKYVN